MGNSARGDSILKLQAWGVNHKTAAVELRERLAFSGDELEEAYATLKAKGYQESMILSTCNRTEIYTVSHESSPEIKDLIQEIKSISVNELNQCSREFQDLDAAEHLFKVVASLDSMVIGEPEIVSQVKQAYQMAKENKAAGKVINSLSQRAFNVAKRVRTETDISSKPTSVGAVGAALALQIFGQQGAKTIAVMGAGEMAEVSLNNLKGKIGDCDILVCNRTLDKAQTLAEQFGGSAFTLEEKEDVWIKADIVICSMGVSEPIIKPELMEKIIGKREGRPLFIIDLGVPRNVDDDLKSYSDVFLYDMDDLQRNAKDNMKYRQQLLDHCQPLIDEGVEDFTLWTHSLANQDVIVDVIRRNNELIDTELQKSLKKLGDLDESQTEEIRYLMNRVLKKAMHHPIHHLRNSQLKRPGPIVSWRQFFFGD